MRLLRWDTGYSPSGRAETIVRADGCLRRCRNLVPPRGHALAPVDLVSRFSTAAMISITA